MKPQHWAIVGVNIGAALLLIGSGCGSSDDKKKAPNEPYTGAGQGGEPSGGESSAAGGPPAQGGAGAVSSTEGGAAGQTSPGGADQGGEGGAVLSGCALGDACCADASCESGLACLGAVCSCAADLVNSYLLRTDGVAFYTPVNDKSQAVVVNADTGMALEGIVDITGSQYHGCAALESGQVRCWSLSSDNIGNNSGQLGNGTVGGVFPALSASRVLVDPNTPLDDVVSVGGGDSGTMGGQTTTCAVKSAGAVFCWGNGAPKIINAATTNSPFATQILTASGGPALTGVTQVAVGYAHACALTKGKVRCWGATDGTGVTKAYPSVDVVGIPGNVLKIGAGYWYSCALSDADGGSVYCWGANNVDQIGVGSVVDVGGTFASPVRVRTSANAFLGGVAELSIAYSGACALGTDHSIWCWGASNRPFATAAKNSDMNLIDNAVQLSTPSGPEAPRYVTDTGVYVSAQYQVMPNCAVQP